MIEIAIYAFEVSGRERNVLRQAGIDVEWTALPKLISRASLKEVDDVVGAFRSLGLDEMLVIRNGNVRRISSKEDTVRALHDSGDVDELAAYLNIPKETLAIEAVETELCWVVLATSPQHGIPPGEALLVDKFSGRIFPRRLVDVEQELGLWDTSD